MQLKRFIQFINENAFSSKLVKNREKLIEEIEKVAKKKDKWGSGVNFIHDLREVFYKLWNDESSSIKSKTDMIHYALDNYGILPAFVILISNYIGQCFNGGHMQYWDNGYASAGSHGVFSNHADTELHELLLKLWQESGFNEFSKDGKNCYEIAKRFNVVEKDEECDYCGGSGQEEVEEEDEDGETYTDYTTCSNCSGSGYIDSSNSRHKEYEVVNNRQLDEELYKNSKHIISDLERYSLSKILD